MLATDVRTTAGALRRLYLARFGFAVAWAVLLVLSTTALDGTGRLGPLTGTLLVLYPLVDLAAAVVDRRSTRDGRPSALLVVNMLLSLAAAIGLVVAVGTGPGDVLLVWGLWAITAGLVQLIVGLSRRALGGQWAMILSGGISVLAGGGFLASSGAASSVTGISGYAVLGGIFFLVSALRLRGVAGGVAR
ncbi:hypothetical protein MHY85_11140 [Cellulomonas sp. ACRRI]|uniref:hypothetical protein n=1 Tax=Cellulomonas sp. ACRRI TaxID=2918188 RepID=UPI001EF263B5|nr:hypothetical protein [Cellulomonas sp. ACRRI]MCG7286523.1 hypothetical protein [Cellulomonas sp. ACRRI]